MKVIKPLRLGVLSRPYEFKRQFRLGVSVLAMFPLSGERSLLPEIALWGMATAELGDSPVLDLGLPKGRPEYLVAGQAFPPDGEATQCPVGVHFAGRRKTLLVTGDRYYVGDSISAPKPFRSMPVDWPHAFGGKGFPKNPSGRGLDVSKVGDLDVCWLPNVEYPQTFVRGPADRPEPAGFRAIDPSWPQRARKAGTYDARWLREDFPGFAQDMDPTYLNLAPLDQHLEDAIALDGHYEIHNMHPKMPVLAGQLPSVRARCFVNRQLAAFDNLEEIDTRLTTVWFFPSSDRGVLVFHGTVVTAEDDASDITHLLVAAEEMDVALPLTHYRDVITRRCDRTQGHLYVLKDSELCPAPFCTADGDADTVKAEAEGEDLVRKRLKKKLRREIEESRAMVASLGLDPDEHGLKVPPEEEPPPSLEKLPEFLARVQAEAEQQQVEQQAEAAKKEKEIEALVRSLGLDYEAIRRETTTKPVGPPAFTAKRQAAELQQMMQQYSAQGLPTDHIQQILDDPETRRVWDESERLGREAYRRTAHFQDPAPTRDADASAATRRELSEGSVKDYSSVDWTGADLSGMNLAGANFEGSFMERVDLRLTNLQGANLRGAVLAHGDLRGVDLRGADLRNANLGGSRLHDAHLEGTQLEGAVLAKANLSNARLDGANVKQTDFSEAVFDKSSLARVQASETTFLKVSMRGVSFEGATLIACNFLELDLAQACFRDADVSKSVFLRIDGTGADFTKAKLHNARFVEGCVLRDAVFAGAELHEANLRETDLANTSFRAATLDGADLSKAKLAGADFYRASAKNARFGKADLSEAKLLSVNLMGATLAGAHLEGADMTGCNLYGADLSRVWMNHNTRYADCLSVRTRVHPTRSESPDFRR